MSTKRKIRRNLIEPPEATELPDAVMQETKSKFADCPIFVLVPVSSGLDPSEVGRKFTEGLDGLMKKAKEPTNKDIIELSATNIDQVGQSALGTEN